MRAGRIGRTAGRVASLAVLGMGLSLIGGLGPASGNDFHWESALSGLTAQPDDFHWEIAPPTGQAAQPDDFHWEFTDTQHLAYDFHWE